ncbi:MAG TPA: hypothetical protein VFA18_17650, partial [Gemmataceae bacterium]|nr:hypothetical protein [Gemmataceae bacterium]
AVGRLIVWPRHLVAGGAVATAVLLLVAGLLLVRRSPASGSAMVADASTNKPVSAAGSPRLPANPSTPPSVAPTAPCKPDAEAPSISRPAAAKPPGPTATKLELGTYVALENWVSVLLARAGEEYPWVVLQPDARVEADQELVSLPGYQSLLTLDGGVNLTLWGSLPELSAGDPVFESVVLLHEPADGRHLDFTLDRGRVHLAAQPKDGRPARVRLRFLGEVWDLEFKEPASEVVIQLYGLPFRSDSGQSAPRAYLDLFVKGGLRVQAGQQHLDLTDRSRVHWEEQSANGPRATPLQALPPWWTTPPDKTAPAVIKTRGSLLEWSRRLGGAAPRADPSSQDKTAPAEVVTTIVNDVADGEDPDNQDVGVLFLAALDQVEPIVDQLQDRRVQNAHVRGAAVCALQNWLARNPRHAEGLVRLLEKRMGSRDVAEQIVALLHFYSKDACRRRATYEGLIAGLAHENPLVRNLAFLQLDRLGASGWLPTEAADIKYDPEDSPSKRQEAIRRWRDLLARGRLPKLGTR